jgi:hypothetical protein
LGGEGGWLEVESLEWAGVVDGENLATFEISVSTFVRS